jgi:hypothetical protein
MEKKASSNATVILIVRHLQTHYATNHLYWGFTVQVARSSKLLNFSTYLNSIDYRQCEIQFAMRVFQTIQDILRNLQMMDEVWIRAGLLCNIFCYISSPNLCCNMHHVSNTTQNAIFHRPSNTAAVINAFYCFH